MAKRSKNLIEFKVTQEKPEVLFKDIKATFGEKQYKRFLEIVKEQEKSIDDHFKTDNWGLDLNLYKADIVHKFLGIDLLFSLIQRVITKNRTVVTENGKFILKLKGKKNAKSNRKTKSK
jgi:hypothetical protein